MQDLHSLLRTLFPIYRSLTGDGVRQTLDIIKSLIPIDVHEIPSGTMVFDWTIPDEWNIKDAWIKDSAGNKIVDFHKCNLHIVGYSEPFYGKMNLEDLKKHLFSLPNYPSWVPYITSYYNRMWGFCLEHNTLMDLKDDIYEVMIDAEFKKGHLTYGDLVIKGNSEEEIMFATNVCHPSMANNELSGPVLTTYLAKYIMDLPERKYTYRFIFTPETIGAIAYLHKNKDHMIKNTKAGFMTICTGGPEDFTYLESRDGNTLTDRITKHILKYTEKNYTVLDYCHRGSDERQYCWPGIDLPIGSLMRSKYTLYKEYHTSGDDLDFVTNEALNLSLDKYKLIVDMLEANKKYMVKTLCEPQLGKRGLYPSLSVKDAIDYVKDLRNVLVFCDGEHDLLDIATRINKSIMYVKDMTDKFLNAGIIEEVR